MNPLHRKFLFYEMLVSGVFSEMFAFGMLNSLNSQIKFKRGQHRYKPNFEDINKSFHFFVISADSSCASCQDGDDTEHCSRCKRFCKCQRNLY